MKNILIYWKWKVGQSLANFCHNNGITYAICDDQDTLQDYDTFDSIIPSPWIPSSHKIYWSGKIVSELDFLFPFIPTWFQIHAITWTDGKSTTSWILYHFLKSWLPEENIYLWGNFWTPLADIVMAIKSWDQKHWHIVLEVSSFMAYAIKKFHASTSILTNLHPDHLDWHKDINEYYHAKFNLLSHTKEAILFPESILPLFPELKDFPIKCIAIKDEIIEISPWIIQINDELFLDISERQLYGKHNTYNIYLASILAINLGISVTKLSEILARIPALPHRLQKISTKHNRIWIDDSKSTTAQSLYAALAAFSPKKVHLISGWKDKWDPFDGLAENLAKYCIQCVVIGETKHIFLQASHDAFIPWIPAATMKEAVQYLIQNSSVEDIILLSPWCSSFDMFKNYEDRAQSFINAIEEN